MDTATETRPAHRRGRPIMGESAKKRAATYRLSPEALELIGALVAELGLSQAGIVEMAIRDLASTRGLRGNASTRATP